MVKQYSTEFKLKIVKMILDDNISKHEIDRTYDVARKTQRDWVKKYKEEGIGGLVSKKKYRDPLIVDKQGSTIEELKHEIFLLKVQIERYKRGYSDKEAEYVKKRYNSL